MLLLLCALILAGAIVWSGRVVGREIAAARESAQAQRLVSIVGIFAPALAGAEDDPRALLVWQPLARTARGLFPGEFAELDKAAGGEFPFSADRIQAAHARWTAEWLGWERAHDAEYKLKAALLESEQTPLLREKVAALDREKLERYQRRYEEYVRVGKALQAFLGNRDAVR